MTGSSDVNYYNAEARTNEKMTDGSFMDHGWIMDQQRSRTEKCQISHNESDSPNLDLINRLGHALPKLVKGKN